MASVNMGNAPSDTPLAREGSSVFSLTFDEFQHALGNPGADFGSMNMDEFLKNLWTAEETQAMAAAIDPFGGSNGALPTQMSLQKQGSFCIPRTLSTKTVEEVWKSVQPQQETLSLGGAGGGQQQREITLGEVTLEDFLVKAGIVREVIPSNPSSLNCQGNGGFPGQGNDARYNTCCNGNAFPVLMEPSGGGPSSTDIMQQDGPQGMILSACTPGQQGDWIVDPYKNAFSQQQQQAAPSYSNISVVTNGGCSGASPGAGGFGKGGLDISFGGGMHLNELGCGAALPLSPGPGESSAATSNQFASQYELLGQSGRKRCADSPIEKVIQRRQRRMIKNRESAARSRARKQAYTVELEEQVSRLKEENRKLLGKQEYEAELRKKQILAVMPSSVPQEGCALKRTFTGPW